MYMKADEKLSPLVVRVILITMYSMMVLGNFSFVLGYGHYGEGTSGFAIIFCVVLMYLCGLNNSKKYLFFFLACGLYSIINYLTLSDSISRTSGFVSHFIDLPLLLPISSLAGTFIWFGYNYSTDHIIILSFIIYFVLVLGGYLAGMYARKQAGMLVRKDGGR